MTSCLEKSCLFDLPCIFLVNVCQFMCVLLHFGSEIGMFD